MKIKVLIVDLDIETSGKYEQFFDVLQGGINIISHWLGQNRRFILTHSLLLVTEADPDKSLFLKEGNIAINIIFIFSLVSGPYGQNFDELKGYLSGLLDDHTLDIETSGPYGQIFDELQ